MTGVIFIFDNTFYYFAFFVICNLRTLFCRNVDCFLMYIHPMIREEIKDERVMTNCVKFLEGKLKLKVNRTKSQVGSPLRLKFLGFSLCKIGKKTGIRPHGKSIKRFKDKIRELTSRKQARPVEIILKRIKVCTAGWLGYYSIANMDSLMNAVTSE